MMEKEPDKTSLGIQSASPTGHALPAAHDEEQPIEIISPPLVLRNRKVGFRQRLSTSVTNRTPPLTQHFFSANYSFSFSVFEEQGQSQLWPTCPRE